MKLSDLKSHLGRLKQIAFKLPNGNLVPSHFHVTEVGLVQKNFIDCGGKMREETKISMQLWEADDYDHRLHPEKLVHILELSEEKLNIPDLEVEVEYQGETISRFSLGFDGDNFLLESLFTDCLARDKCAPKQPAFSLEGMISDKGSCSGDSGCC